MPLQETRFHPWAGKSLWRREWPPTVFLSGERGLAESQRVRRDWATKHSTVLYWFSFYFSKVCKFSRVTIMILKFLEFLLCARPHANHFTSFILFKSSQGAHKGGAVTLQRKLRLREIRVPISDGEQISKNKLCSHKHLEMLDKMYFDVFTACLNSKTGRRLLRSERRAALAGADAAAEGRCLPWGSGGQESTLQCKGHWFHPWPRGTPQAACRAWPRGTPHAACRVWSRAHAWQQEKPLQWEAPLHSQLEKACAQQRWPSTAPKKKKMSLGCDTHVDRRQRAWPQEGGCDGAPSHGLGPSDGYISVKDWGGWTDGAQPIHPGMTRCQRREGRTPVWENRASCEKLRAAVVLLTYTKSEFTWWWLPS